MVMCTGCLFIITAPSGTGKTSLVRALLENDADLRLSISYTSRPPREGEVHERDYHFVSRAMFEQMQANGDFLESAEVYGNWYGTSQRWISDTMQSGQDIVLEIDSQGAVQVRKFFPQSIGIFVLPPSARALEERLLLRDKDAADVIQRRLDAVCEEVSHVNEFDYVIINNILEDAICDLACIVKAERLKRERQLQMQKNQVLVSQLMSF
ncbi:MAG: guanylate kinase [Nitrosomonas sp.]|nr:guanylate kinase [Nitrosomonas sp.]